MPNQTHRVRRRPRQYSRNICHFRPTLKTYQIILLTELRRLTPLTFIKGDWCTVRNKGGVCKLIYCWGCGLVRTWDIWHSKNWTILRCFLIWRLSIFIMWLCWGQTFCRRCKWGVTWWGGYKIGLGIKAELETYKKVKRDNSLIWREVCSCWLMLL